ncbi:hypothetical protein [Microcoleus sp. D2_18a_B4]|uniref:hypothetical protein n=1 Tax=Microcoleus sp. D2_18a_B4 TaxID=3055329 RepID=UPI002FCF4C8C
MYQFQTFVITATISVVMFCYFTLKYLEVSALNKFIALCAIQAAIGSFYWVFFTASGKNFARNQNNKLQNTVVNESHQLSTNNQDHTQQHTVVDESHKLFAEGEALRININFNSLMEKYKKLSTFDEVAEWDKEAESAIAKIVVSIERLDTLILKYSSNVNTFTQEKFKNKYKEILENMAEKLQEAIDFTPKNSEEKKTLLKELTLAKKELQLQKREVAATMKNVNQESRSKSVRAGSYLWMYNSKIAAKERRKIRYQRDAELKPNEATKAAIERQILQIDKDIMLIKHFTK